MRTIQEILGSLRNVRKQGQGWVACCPSHKDEEPSLSVGQGADGKLLLRCHAGCSFGDILAALGMEGNGELPTFAKEEREAKQKPLYPTLEEALKAYKKGRPDARWEYYDRDGILVGAVCRWDGAEKASGKCKKDIRPLAFDFRRDGWVQEQMPIPRPLWRLPELLAAEPQTLVYVCEGEKAAEAGQTIGVLTTTSAGGSNAAKQSDWKSLAGRRVVILPDNDKPGVSYAATVTGLLEEAGASEILVVKLPVPREGDDLYDWVAKGGTAEALEGLVEEARKQAASEALAQEEKKKAEAAKRQAREEEQKTREEKQKTREDAKKAREEKQVRAQDEMRSAMRLDRTEDWQKKLRWRYGRDGEVRGLLPKASTASNILMNAPEWQGVLAFDEMAQSPLFLKMPPFPQTYKIKGPFPRMLKELDYTMMDSYFEEVWGFSLTIEGLFAAVEWASMENPLHPVKDYLQSLRWDGVSRVETWLRTYLGAKASASRSETYVDLAGKMWMISAVARAFQPGCQADHVLVLEGREELGKSSALRILGGEFYSDAPLLIGEKDTYIGLQGKWIVELGEVEALLKTESSAAKAFFTTGKDRYRQPYAKKAIDVPRSCVFAGTANHNDYIKDSSGGRRYWPVECTRDGREALKQDRDQLWAEAVALYEQGVKWHPEGEDVKALFRMEQEARQTDDPWEGPIVRELSSRSQDQFTPAELLLALGLETQHQKKADQTRVGIIMQRLGWERVRRREGGELTTTYHRPPKPGSSSGSSGPKGGLNGSGGSSQPLAKATTPVLSASAPRAPAPASSPQPPPALSLTPPPLSAPQPPQAAKPPRVQTPSPAPQPPPRVQTPSPAPQPPPQAAPPSTPQPELPAPIPTHPTEAFKQAIAAALDLGALSWKESKSENDVLRVIAELRKEEAKLWKGGEPALYAAVQRVLGFVNPQAPNKLWAVLKQPPHAPKGNSPPSLQSTW